MHKQKHKHHQKNYNSLKVKLYRIEQLLDQLSKKTRRRFKCEVKSFINFIEDWVWTVGTKIKEIVMPGKRGGKKASSGSMNKKNKNKTFKPKRGKRS